MLHVHEIDLSPMKTLSCENLFGMFKEKADPNKMKLTQS